MEQLTGRPFSLLAQISSYLADLDQISKGCHYGRNCKVFLITFHFLSHSFLAALPGEHPFFRYICYDFYYLSLGNKHFRVIKFLYSFIVLPLLFFSHQIFWAHPHEYSRNAHRLLRQYYGPGIDIGKGKAILETRKDLRTWLASVTAQLISLSREFHIYHTIIFMVMRVDILVHAELSYAQWAMSMVAIVFNFTMHFYGTKAMVNMYLPILLQLILFDGLVHSKLNRMNNKIYRRCVVSIFYRTCIGLLKYFHKYSQYFACLFSVFLYVLMPVLGVALLLLLKVKTWLDSMMLFFGFSMAFLAGFCPMIMFGFYVERFHKRYHSLNRYEAFCRQPKRALQLVKLAELLGGPTVGIKYYKLDVSITHHSIVSFFQIYMQFLVIAASLIFKGNI